MNNLGLILLNFFLLDVLLGFCFKNLDSSATKLEHFDDCLTTLFTIITICHYEPILSVCFLQLKQYVCMFYNDGNIYLTTCFKHLNFIK